MADPVTYYEFVSSDENPLSFLLVRAFSRNKHAAKTPEKLSNVYTSKELNTPASFQFALSCRLGVVSTETAA